MTENIRILNPNTQFQSKKEYVKAFKEAQAAHLKHEKADANMDISRAELEKAKNNMLFRSQQCEDSKNAYALCTQNANKKQQQHYGSSLPAVLEVCFVKF